MSCYKFSILFDVNNLHLNLLCIFLLRVKLEHIVKTSVVFVHLLNKMYEFCSTN